MQGLCSASCPCTQAYDPTQVNGEMVSRKGGRSSLLELLPDSRFAWLRTPPIESKNKEKDALRACMMQCAAAARPPRCRRRAWRGCGHGRKSSVFILPAPLLSKPPHRTTRDWTPPQAQPRPQASARAWREEALVVAPHNKI